MKTDRRAGEIAAEVEHLGKRVARLEEVTLERLTQRVARLVARLEAIEGLSSMVQGMDARLLKVELEATTLEAVADLQGRIEALEAR